MPIRDKVNLCNERSSSTGVFIKADLLTDRIKDLSRAIRWNDWPKNYKEEQFAESSEFVIFYADFAGIRAHVFLSTIIIHLSLRVILHEAVF